MSAEDACETIYFSNGWIEVRNPHNANDEWIATDSPCNLER